MDRVYWMCKCECGTIKSIRGDSLIKGDIKACGCLHHDLEDLTGLIFGRLLVLYRDEVRSKRSPCYWMCKCECGTIKSIRGDGLRSHAAHSCGCLHKEIISKQTKERHRKNRIRNSDSIHAYIIKNKKSRDKLTNLNKKTKARDLFTCRLCGKRETALYAHHIEKFSDATEKRDDPMNLITLCKPCHLAAHNHDTRGPVSPEIQKQLMEIIQSLYFSASFSQDTIVLLLQTH